MSCYYNLFTTTVGPAHPNPARDWRKQHQQIAVGEISGEKVLLPLAPAQSDPHTKSSSSCSCRTASKDDTKHLELKIQCSWLLSEYMESLRSSKDTVK